MTTYLPDLLDEPRRVSPVLLAEEICTLQVNITLLCNQRCRHCHLACGPDRVESMDSATMGHILPAARIAGVERVDITGGAPELHPQILNLVSELTDAGLAVQLRTNLTALAQPAQADLISLLAERGVALVASLPCYLPENVDAQRGDDTYRKSIEVLARLNRAGFGLDDGPELSLVYNPAGPELPGDQSQLQADYKQQLQQRLGLGFTRLLTIANMPIGRFADQLTATGQAEAYLQLLAEAYNPAALDRLMCRSQVTVGWDGRLYDCDFNHALGLGVASRCGHISRFDPDQLRSRRIVMGPHCLACMAGSGSSCSGALT